MTKLPDHPDIRAMELTGYPRGAHPVPFCTCERCDDEIRIGEDYYDIDGTILCKRCIEDCRMTAGKEDY